MAYTIDYFYNKFLDKIDKEGSDIYSVPQVMELLESETYNFIEETVKYIENTQQIRDYIQPLSKPYSYSLVDNPNNAGEMLAALPSDYLNLETARVTTPGQTVRVTRVLRKGEFNINERNPNKKVTPEYPVVIIYNDYLAVIGSKDGGKIDGFYIKKPTFGNHEGDTSAEIVVDLPDHSVEKILNLMVSEYDRRTADPRYQASINQEQSFGKSYK